MKALRLLFVTDSLPYPPRKGYLTMTFHQIEHLAARHSIDLVSFSRADAATTPVGPLADWCNDIEIVKLPLWRSLLNIAGALPSRTPLTVAYYRSEKMGTTLQAKLKANAYDVVIFQLGRMAQYLPATYHGATLLNMVDPMILNYQRSLRWRPWHDRIALSLEVRRLKQYEQAYAPNFDRVLLVAEEDVRSYSEFLPGAKVGRIPYGTDTTFFTSSSDVARKKGMIVLTGSMFYAPNIDAVNYFCREIFPLIRQRVPHANLWLVGSDPAASVRKWGKIAGIHITGSVPDIRPYLNEAMVSVCPIRLKVGIQTKILEALAMGTPVVTTTAGSNGIGAVSGKHLYEADSPVEFADRVVALLNGEEWSHLSTSGRSFVVENYDWVTSVARLEEIFQELTNPGPDADQPPSPAVALAARRGA